MIRDYALAASGLLVRKIGGPSVKPYQPDGRLGSGGHDRQQHARLPARQRREPLSPQHVHASGSGPPRRRRWTSSTPRAARSAPSAASGPTRRCRRWSRSTIRSSSRRPGTWRERRCKQGGDNAETRASTSSPGACCWPGRSGPRRRRWCETSLDDLLGLLQGARRRGEEADRRRRIEGRCRRWTRRRWPPGRCWPMS